jgi:hypothetical protein
MGDQTQTNHSQRALQICNDPISILNLKKLQFTANTTPQTTYVSHPPRPRTETWSPEFPSLRYCIPVFLGSDHAMSVRNLLLGKEMIMEERFEHLAN